jgi:hypothetical protein
LTDINSELELRRLGSDFRAIISAAARPYRHTVAPGF